MARRIEHRTTSEWPASEVGPALLDPEYLRARLDQLGGPNAELIKHEPTADGVRFQVRQGIRAELLPPIARNALGGDVRIERSESWRRTDEGHYTGEVAAEITGVPCSITGSMWLRELPGDAGCELVVDGTVQVNIPLLGSKLEQLVADELRKLLDAEDQFTNDWLAQHR